MNFIINTIINEKDKVKLVSVSKIVSILVGSEITVYSADKAKKRNIKKRVAIILFM